MIDGRVACLVLYKVGNGLVVVVKPAVLVAPVALEVLLYHLHLLAHRLLGILLHLGVQCGVDFESVTLQVQFQALFFGNVLDFARHSLAEVRCHTIIVALDVVFQVDGQR